VARDNSSVVARVNSSVVARDNSSVVARGNSSVEARDNSSVEAWDNSSVEAWDNSSVVARGNSSVEAWDNVGVHCFSASSTLTLYGFVAVWLIVKAKKIIKKSKTVKIITSKVSTGTKGWLEREGIEIKSSHVVLFKRVSQDYKTQEVKPWETSWPIGSTVTHPDYRPKETECGNGKFHACSRPYFCDEFRREKRDDRYIAVRIAVKDLYAWPNAEYPHKISFRECEVLHDCTRFGNQIIPKPEAS
jgi:hypothetical protein